MQVALSTKTMLPWAEESMDEICWLKQIKGTQEVSPGAETGFLLQNPAPLLPEDLDSNLLQTRSLKILGIPKALGQMSDKQHPILGSRLLLSS